MADDFDSFAERLDLARRGALESALDHLNRAVTAYDAGDYPLACFLAMTAIEEAGKTPTLHMGRMAIEAIASPGNLPPRRGQSDATDHPPNNGKSAASARRELERLFCDHSEKARQAATAALYINAGADRRHGAHPTSGLHRTSGVVLLARSRRWMDLRNRCLYVDFDFESGETKIPRASVDASTAHYFIVMAFETLAAVAVHGIGPGDPLSGDYAEAHGFDDERLAEMDVFIRRTANGVDVDQLDFLRHPEPLQREADLRDLAPRTSGST